VLSPGVTIEPGAVVRDSIVMFDTIVRKGAVLDRAIVDKDCEIGEGATVGAGNDLRRNRREPERLYAGAPRVGERARAPAGVTVAWVDGVGLSLWAYYGLEAMEIPRRVLHRMLRANFDYPFVKFALTDDDRPMLISELPTPAVTLDELARGLVRLSVVADRLL